VKVKNVFLAFNSSDEISSSRVYSGDFTDPAKARVHQITRVIKSSGLAILKICPHLHAYQYKAISLNPNTMFDFSTNASGKIMVISLSTWV
jgi:hypothetical protein